MNNNRIVYTLILLFFVLNCRAEEAVAADNKAEDSIIMNKATANGMTVYIFKINGKNSYRLVCFGKSIQRTLFAGDSGVRITEYDFDKDGFIDAIQIGRDDTNFSPYLVQMINGEVDIVSFPDDWKKESKYPYDTFVEYIKKTKGIK
jgi:hypothetical protein